MASGAWAVRRPRACGPSGHKLLLGSREPHACCVPGGRPGLQAYDQHLNMILGDVEESTTTTVIDEETYEEIVKVGARAPLRLAVDPVAWGD
eukprot:scaffold3767_cov242-Prasinococcus_capsulatus_cf.AAC.4